MNEEWFLYQHWYDGHHIIPALHQSFSYGIHEDRATGSLYSKADGQDWPAGFASVGPLLLDLLDGLTGVKFEIVAFQAYRNGSGCGWHADTPFDSQAILSLGVTRTFGIRPAGGEASWLRLGHGDLMYMPAGFQVGWEHCVATENVIGERCSLVFRTPV